MTEPSKAAREAAKDIESYLGLQDCTKPIQAMVAKRIDKAIAELLEKADVVANECSGPEHMLDALAAALEPWKIPVENRKPGE